MPAWLLALLPKALDLIIGWMGGGKKDAGFAEGRELGRAEQQNADSKADMATVKAANEAAKKVQQEPVDAPDPNDRDAR